MVIAHRGSMGYFPEHTRIAYYYSFFEGADFVDVDVHPTKDGHLIVNHHATLIEGVSGMEDNS